MAQIAPARSIAIETPRTTSNQPSAAGPSNSPQPDSTTSLEGKKISDPAGTKPSQERKAIHDNAKPGDLLNPKGEGLGGAALDALDNLATMLLVAAGRSPGPARQKSSDVADLGDEFNKEKHGDIVKTSKAHSDPLELSFTKKDEVGKVHVLDEDGKVIDTGRKNKNGSFFFGRSHDGYPENAILLVELKNGTNFHVKLHAVADSTAGVA